MSNDMNTVSGSLLPNNSAAKSNQAETRPRTAEERQTVSAKQQEVITRPATESNRAQLDRAITELIQRAQVRGTRIQFEIEDNYGEIVLQVLDAKNREMIRQIPPQEILEFAQFFRDLETTQGGMSMLNAQNLATGLSIWEGLLIDVKV